jgi:hypothetical protein
LLGAQDGQERWRRPSVHELKNTLQFVDTPSRRFIGSVSLMYLGKRLRPGGSLGSSLAVCLDVHLPRRGRLVERFCSILISLAWSRRTSEA